MVDLTLLLLHLQVFIIFSSDKHLTSNRINKYCASAETSLIVVIFVEIFIYFLMDIIVVVVVIVVFALLVM